MCYINNFYIMIYLCIFLLFSMQYLLNWLFLLQIKEYLKDFSKFVVVVVFVVVVLLVFVVKKEEKKLELESEFDDDMGFGLFD